MRYFILLFFLITTNAFAWLCPNNFNTITPGDTLTHVQAACGKPITANQSTMAPNVPQEWGYYVSVAPPDPATVKMSVVFANKKVVNITVNAMSLVSSNVCGGTIAVGDLEETVKAVCGNPMFINKGAASPNQKKIGRTELLYNGPSPNTLVFENGILKERK